MTFFEYMLDQFSGLGGGMMFCFFIGMFMVIPLALVCMAVGAKIGTFLGEGLIGLIKSIIGS